MSRFLKYSVPVSSVPPAGKHFRIEASQAERAELAAAMEIEGVDRFVAELDVRPIGARDFAVQGVLAAIVVQADVVTLDPVRQEVAEKIELTLKPAEEPSGRPRVTGDEESDDDDADVYRHGRIDLGRIVAEHLALGLDPYPRAPETVFEGYIEDRPEAPESPFAALAALKKDRG